MKNLREIILTLVILFSAISATQTSDILTKSEEESYKYLYRIVSQNKLDSVRLILENKKIDLLKFDNENNTPILYAAAWSGSEDMVQYLIDKGADPRAKTSSNETALHRAAWNGNLEIVKLLVQKGADLHIIYNVNGGLSPLCCAAESGNIDVVKYLIEKGADVNYTNESSGASPLRSAAYKAHNDIFLLLAQYQPASYNWQEGLSYALIGGNLDIVRYVIEEKKANVNKKSEIWDEYPIEQACADRYIYNENAQPLEVVKYLVSKGAKLNKINKGNVFEWAMENSTEATMEYMLDQGVKVSIPQTEDGWTPLALALDNNNFVLARYLIRKTKDHTFRNEPLIVFFADGMDNSPQIVDLLIEEGINKGHYTEAFCKSVARNDSISAHLLLDAGVDIKTLNSDGSNILSLTWNYELAKFLIEKGADVRNEVMLANAWENWHLLRALEEENVMPPISQAQMDFTLGKAALAGDAWTLQYMLKRGAEVNSSESYPDSIEGGDDRYKPIGNQTPLIKSAIQGYSHCSYGNYSDENQKVQISPRIAELLIAAGADVNMVDSQQKTALHYTTTSQRCQASIGPIPMGGRRDRERGFHGDPAMPPQQYHDSIAHLLIKSGANINTQDKEGNTPLILAAINRNHDVLKMLLDAKADISIKNKEDKVFFDYLNDQASFQVIKEAGLWEYIPQESLNSAFVKFFTDYSPRSEYDVEKLKMLINYGADVNTKLYPDNTTNALWYTFNRMYGKNKIEIAQALVDGGIDLYNEDYSGYTLLMSLIKEGKFRDSYSDDKEPTNILFFIKNKIGLNQKSTTLYTALGIANSDGQKEIARLLTKHGAKRELESEWWYLVKERNHAKETITKLQQLVKEGIDVNIQTPIGISKYMPKVNQKGVTALMFLIAYGRENAVKALLELGADINIKAADGSTALSVAKDRSNKKITDMLLQAGAKE